MPRLSVCLRALPALTALAALSLAAGAALGDDAQPTDSASPSGWSSSWFGASTDEAIPPAVESSLLEESGAPIFTSRRELLRAAAEEDLTVVSRLDDTAAPEDEAPWSEEMPAEAFLDPYVCRDWTWQMLPTGLIYRSYWAGPHEPRISINMISEGGRTLQDATIGGRGGVIRYGNNDPTHPEGYQLDVYGAAVARLDGDNNQDLDSSDYVFGFPITYGIDEWQFKFGYAHVSSHLGDELALRVPGTLDDRINYVRDSLVFGSSYYMRPAWRLYGESGWAFNASGGAAPWEAKVGTELARGGPTGTRGTPFLAINGDLNQEHDFGGNLTAQAGWLWRGITGQVFRLGAHYFNGKSSQYQFFRQSEEQMGMGVWYDF